MIFTSNLATIAAGCLNFAALNCINLLSLLMNLNEALLDENLIRDRHQDNPSIHSVFIQDVH